MLSDTVMAASPRSFRLTRGRRRVVGGVIETKHFGSHYRSIDTLGVWKYTGVVHYERYDFDNMTRLCATDQDLAANLF